MSLVITAIGMHILSPKNKLDVRFHYSTLEANEFFDKLTPLEMNDYAQAEMLDLFFIINYSLLTFIIFHSFFTQWGKYLLFVPGSIDLVETCSILLKLKNHQISLSILSFSTTAKWLSGLIVLIVLIYRFKKTNRNDA